MFSKTFATSNFSLPVEYTSLYRYGYQGSEKDDEIKGSGNSYTTEYRILDTRIARWLSLDPKSSATPVQSPYVSMDNNPIMFDDPLGDIVGYEKFRDKVNVTVARVFSKSFNTQYKAFKSDEDVTFTYKKRENNPTLYEGPKDTMHLKIRDLKICFGEMQTLTRSGGKYYYP